MFSSHINRTHSGFMIGAIAALLFSLPCGVLAQSPLSAAVTGRVGVDNTNPSEGLEVSGTVKANAFKGDGSQLTDLPVPVGAESADAQIFAPRLHLLEVFSTTISEI